MAFPEVSTVTINIEGIGLINLTSNGDGTYSATGTAPNWSAHSHGGSLAYTVNATADTGTTATPVTGSVRLIEQNAPIFKDVTPSSGATVTVNNPTITFKVVDNEGGESNDYWGNAGYSGVDISKLSHTITDSTGQKITNCTVEYAAITGGYSVTLTLPSGKTLADGSISIALSVQDFDGNTGTSSSTFVVRTAVPNINVTSPVDGYKTKTSTVSITGTCSSQAGTINRATVSVNGGSETNITVNSAKNGFTGSATLSEGSNKIIVRVYDSDGLSNLQTITVYYSSKLPVISNVRFDPEVLKATGRYTITCTVTI